MTGKYQILARLTRKQREVLALVAGNRTSKEIAAQLGISVSAVNQRIETMRSRLGWIPRGELARLYRQAHVENRGESRELSVTWEKIQVPDPVFSDQAARAESASNLIANGSHRSMANEGSGSQLTATLFQSDNTWLWRDNRVTALVRVVVTTAIIAAAIAFAAIASTGPSSFGP